MRLQRLGGRARNPKRSASGRAATTPARIEVQVEAQVDARAEPRAEDRAEGLAKRLGGTAVGEHLIRIDTQLPLVSGHGTRCLAEAQEPIWPLTTVPGPIVGLDTETTGLAGGTGTLAFMVGIAEAKRDHVHLRQWLLTAFSGEAAMLDDVAEALVGAGLLVSYNGKGFDLPLLRDRRRLRRGVPLVEPPHLDLLVPVRRLFRKVWPDCRLVTAEQRLLGLFRHQDLPGSEAPRAWRDHLAGRGGDGLQQVLRHNALDVLSLLVLGPVLARALHDPLAYGADPLAVAETWTRCGEEARALALLERGRDRLDTRGRLVLARALRRAGRWPDAVAVWECLAGEGCAEAVEHLAKYHEHIRGDWSRALVLANRLEEGPEARRRRTRLVRRLGPQRRFDF